MTAALVALLGALTAAGAVALAWGLRPVVLPEPSARPARRVREAVTAVVAALRRHGSRLAWGSAGGVGLLLVTGWPLALLLVPLAAVGLPALLTAPPNREVELLQALDRWVRGLAATLPTGRSITDAIRLSTRQAPELLAPHLRLLTARLDDRWTPQQGLYAMADDLAAPDADAVLAALALAAQRGGTGATATLTALADSIQDRLKALREIETERAKPRIVVKQVTIITVTVLAGALVFGRDFFAPYGTPVGQLILAGLIGVYVASLVLLRRMTLPRRRERIVRSVR